MININILVMIMINLYEHESTYPFTDEHFWKLLLVMVDILKTLDNIA